MERINKAQFTCSVFLQIGFYSTAVIINTFTNKVITSSQDSFILSVNLVAYYKTLLTSNGKQKSCEFECSNLVIVRHKLLNTLGYCSYFIRRCQAV